MSRLFEKVLIDEVLREKGGIGQAVYDKTIGAAKNAVQQKIVEPVKQKAGEIAKGVGTAALMGGAIYAGAKMGQKRGEDQAAAQAAKSSPAAQITGSMLNLDKQKYSQLAKIYDTDPELKQNHSDDGAVIRQIDTALQKVKGG